jgi:hypothetical protein
MIKLNVALTEKAVEQLNFESVNEFIDCLKSYRIFKKSIWLVTNDGENGEIIITQNFDNILLLFEFDYFQIDTNINSIIHVQRYNNYLDAYEVAKGMKEDNDYFK